MEIIKKRVHMNRFKDRIQTDITLDDDFIVPDVKADIDDVVTSEGEVIIDSIRVFEGRVNIRGRLGFKLLYMSHKSSGQLNNMTGNLDFDENMLMDGVKEGDIVNVKGDIEDLSVGIINTRKVSARAVVTLECIWEEEQVADIVTDVEKQEEEHIDCLKNNMVISQLAVNKKDIVRVREELKIPSGKGNIESIVWSSVHLKNTSTRLERNKVVISGQIGAVVLYSTDGEKPSLQWIEETIPVSGSVDVTCTEDMIPDIEVSTSSVNVTQKPDSDGEERIVELDVVIELGIKIYAEETIEYISDMYSTAKEILLETKDTCFNTILLKNTSKAKVSDRLKIQGQKPEGGLMQLLSSDGVVKLDKVEVKARPEEEKMPWPGILVTGIVTIDVLYISSDDMKPVAIARQVMPFNHTIEAYGIEDDSLVFIRPYIEQLNTTMSGNNEIEAKAVVVFDTLVLNSVNKEVITDASEQEFDMLKVKEIPCMAGYCVKENDTLWKIAKKYYTTVEKLQKVNELSGTQISEGQMLLVVKNIKKG